MAFCSIAAIAIHSENVIVFGKGNPGENLNVSSSAPITKRSHTIDKDAGPNTIQRTRFRYIRYRLIQPVYHRLPLSIVYLLRRLFRELQAWGRLLIECSHGKRHTRHVVWGAMRVPAQKYRNAPTSLTFHKYPQQPPAGTSNSSYFLFLIQTVVCAFY